MKVALYSRVSKRQTQTTENQTIILKKHAERMEWDYDVYTEKESTRKTRPIKYQLMQDLRAGKYEAVCVLKLDRWARSMTELVLEIKELFEKKIAFISIRDNIDLSTATGKLQFNIMAAFAEFERDLISERTKDGLARAVANGRRLGRPKGAKDTYKRKRSGYWLRHASKKTVEKYKDKIVPEKENKNIINRKNVRKYTRKNSDRVNLKKKMCKECGSKDNLEFHHLDYNDYKKVDVLCVDCHYKKHGRKPPKKYPNKIQPTILKNQEGNL